MYFCVRKLNAAMLRERRREKLKAAVGAIATAALLAFVAWAMYKSS